jgi:hypothetical protein
MQKNIKPLPDWEAVLSSAARLQTILPDAVLVGGTASAIFANHRLSTDADHVIPDLKQRFDAVLEDLESVAGLTTARVKRPVLILGSLDGIETGIRQLIRDEPLETKVIDHKDLLVTVPTEEEILRIKGILILKRNATRYYLDFAALSDHLGDTQTASALASFDRLYAQPNGESALQQLKVQLANALPYDLSDTDLSEYKKLNQRWQNWDNVKLALCNIAISMFDQVAELEKKLLKIGLLLGLKLTKIKTRLKPARAFLN